MASKGNPPLMLGNQSSVVARRKTSSSVSRTGVSCISGASSPAYARFTAKYAHAETFFDADGVQEPLARAAFKEPGDYPLLLLMGEYPDCRFASAGYSVGSVELIAKLAALL